MKNKVFYKIGIVLLICVLWLAAGISLGAPNKKPQGKVVMVVIDRISLPDLIDYNTPNIHTLINHGAIGLMNTNVANTAERSGESTFATIGAGSRIDGKSMGQAFNIQEEFQGEKIKDIFFRRTGYLSHDMNVVNIGIAQSLRANAELNYKTVQGILGQTLKDSGIGVAVIGNSDINIDPFFRRQVSAIGMDEKGVVEKGIVDKRVYTVNPQSPMGIRTNYSALLDYYKQFKKDSNFIVIDLGDTARVYEGLNVTMDRKIEEQKRDALISGDKFIGNLVKDLDLNKDLLLVVTPTPGIDYIKNKNSLTPVLIVGKGVKHGVLSSDTTKRLGLITNIDLTASVLDFFNLKIPSMIIGRSIESYPMENAANYLTNLEDRTVLTSTIRSGFISTFVTIDTILFLLGALFIYKKREWGPKLRPFLVYLLSIPISFYLMPMFPLGNIMTAIIVFLGLSIGITLLALLFGRKHILDPFIIVALLTILAISIDLLTGTNLGTSCILSYDPFIGARFYGIGNEFMGVLIGAAILFTTGLIQRFNLGKKSVYLSIACYLFITYLIAAPNLGTNVGGTIAAAGGFIVTAVMLMKIRINKKVALSIIGGIALVVGIFILFDMSRSPANQTHIGRTINLMLTNGIGVAGDIIVRKVEVNIKLINYSHWSRDYAIPLAVLLWLLYRPIKLAEELRREIPTLVKGFVGIIIGSIFALVFNDSGILAAATMIIYASAPMLSIALSKTAEKDYI